MNQSVLGSAKTFAQAFVAEYDACEWQPHPRYSVFTQWDREHYLSQREQFLHKYRCFYAIARTIRPASMIELGTYAGSSADAYLSASPEAEFLGVDLFSVRERKGGAGTEDPYEVARALLDDRGFQRARLLRADLRSLERLPETAELVIVDAAHDTYNAYEDLKLALTASPGFIWIDDARAEFEAMPAIQRFLSEAATGRIHYTVEVDYIGGGLLIALDGGAQRHQSKERR